MYPLIDDVADKKFEQQEARKSFLKMLYMNW